MQKFYCRKILRASRVTESLHDMNRIELLVCVTDSCNNNNNNNNSSISSKHNVYGAVSHCECLPDDVVVDIQYITFLVHF